MAALHQRYRPLKPSRWSPPPHRTRRYRLPRHHHRASQFRLSRPMRRRHQRTRQRHPLGPVRLLRRIPRYQLTPHRRRSHLLRPRRHPEPRFRRPRSHRTPSLLRQRLKLPHPRQSPRQPPRTLQSQRNRPKSSLRCRQHRMHRSPAIKTRRGRSTTRKARQTSSSTLPAGRNRPAAMRGVRPRCAHAQAARTLGLGFTERAPREITAHSKEFIQARGRRACGASRSAAGLASHSARVCPQMSTRESSYGAGRSSAPAIARTEFAGHRLGRKIVGSDAVNHFRPTKLGESPIN